MKRCRRYVPTLAAPWGCQFSPVQRRTWDLPFRRLNGVPFEHRSAPTRKSHGDQPYSPPRKRWPDAWSANQPCDYRPSGCRCKGYGRYGGAERRTHGNYGVRFDSPAEAHRKVKHLNDLAAVATKIEHVVRRRFGLHAASTPHTVNVSPEQNLGMGMALRRSGTVGSEGGVLARQLFARMMAPTAKGREAAAQAGINLDEHSSHGTIGASAIPKHRLSYRRTSLKPRRQF